MAPSSDALAPAPDRLTQQVLRVCDAVGALNEYWGFKAINGRVWTLLALSSAPRAQTEMAELLGVSRSLMSATVAELVEHGVVRATGPHRNAPYEAVLDVWPAITSVLRSREWLLLETPRSLLEGLIQEAEHSGAGPYSLERMRVLLAMVEAVQTLLRLVVAMRLPESVKGIRRWTSKIRGVFDRLRSLR